MVEAGVTGNGGRRGVTLRRIMQAIETQIGCLLLAFAPVISIGLAIGAFALMPGFDRGPIWTLVSLAVAYGVWLGSIGLLYQIWKR